MRLPTIGASSLHGPGSVRRSFPPPYFLIPHASGVDISDASIKWITLSPGPERHRRVVEWGELPLPPGIVVGGIVHDAHALSAALGEVKARMSGPLAAHAALPEEAAYVFGMHVPEGSDRKQILSMIEFEFDGRVPIPPSAAVYDYNVILKHDEGEEIGVVVFPRDVAAAYAAAFAGAGITLCSLEVEARSIARAVSSGESDEPITLLVDFGRTRTGFAVLKRGMPIFTSTVDVGGNTLIAGIQKALLVSAEEAQTFSNEQGLMSQEKETSAGSEAIVGTASALCDEIARHYHYWDTRRNDKGERMTPVGKIVLVGGNANMRGLPEYIAGRVQANVSRGDVWRHVCDFDEYVPPIDARTSLQLATAVGLALRGL